MGNKKVRRSNTESSHINNNLLEISEEISVDQEKENAKMFILSLINTKPSIFKKDNVDIDAMLDRYVPEYIEPFSGKIAFDFLYDVEGNPSLRTEEEVTDKIYEGIFKSLEEGYQGNKEAVTLIRHLRVLGGSVIDSIVLNYKIDDPLAKKKRTGLFYQYLPALAKLLGIDEKIVVANKGNKLVIAAPTTDPSEKGIIDRLASLEMSPEALEKAIETQIAKDKKLAKASGAKRERNKAKARMNAIRSVFLRMRVEQEGELLENLSIDPGLTGFFAGFESYFKEGEKPAETITDLGTIILEAGEKATTVYGVPGKVTLEGEFVSANSFKDISPGTSAAAQTALAAMGIDGKNLSMTLDDEWKNGFTVINATVNQGVGTLTVRPNGVTDGTLTITTNETNEKVTISYLKKVTVKEKNMPPRMVTIGKYAAVPMSEYLQQTVSIFANWQEGQSGDPGLTIDLKRRLYKDLLTLGISATVTANKGFIPGASLSGRIPGLDIDWSAPFNLSGGRKAKLFQSIRFSKEVARFKNWAIRLSGSKDLSGKGGTIAPMVVYDQPIKEASRLIQEKVTALQNDFSRGGFVESLGIAENDPQRAEKIRAEAIMHVTNHLNNGVVDGLQKYVFGIGAAGKTIWGQMQWGIQVMFGITTYDSTYYAMLGKENIIKRDNEEITQALKNLLPHSDGSITAKQIQERIWSIAQYDGYSFDGFIDKSNIVKSNAKTSPLTIDQRTTVKPDSQYRIHGINVVVNETWRGYIVEVYAAKGTSQAVLADSKNYSASEYDQALIEAVRMDLQSAQIIEEIVLKYKKGSAMAAAVKKGDLDQQWCIAFEGCQDSRQLSDKTKQLIAKLNDECTPSANKIAALGTLAGFEVMDARHEDLDPEKNPEKVRAELNRKLKPENRKKTVTAAKDIWGNCADYHAGAEQLIAQINMPYQEAIGVSCWTPALAYQFVVQSKADSADIITIVPGQKIDILGRIYRTAEGVVFFQFRGCNGNLAIGNPLPKSAGEKIKLTVAGESESHKVGIQTERKVTSISGSFFGLNPYSSSTQTLIIASKESTSTEKTIKADIADTKGIDGQSLVVTVLGQTGEGKLIRFDSLNEMEFYYRNGKLDAAGKALFLQLKAAQQADIAAGLYNEPFTDPRTGEVFDANIVGKERYYQARVSAGRAQGFKQFDVAKGQAIEQIAAAKNQGIDVYFYREGVALPSAEDLQGMTPQQMAQFLLDQGVAQDPGSANTLAEIAELAIATERENDFYTAIQEIENDPENWDDALVKYGFLAKNVVQVGGDTTTENYFIQAFNGSRADLERIATGTGLTAQHAMSLLNNPNVIFNDEASVQNIISTAKEMRKPGGHDSIQGDHNLLDKKPFFIQDVSNDADGQNTQLPEHDPSKVTPEKNVLSERENAGDKKKLPPNTDYLEILDE